MVSVADTICHNHPLASFATQVISVLPEKAAEEAAVKAVESTEDVDPKTKMEVLRKEQETIKAERAAAKKASEEKRREAKDLARKAAAQLKESGKLDEILATQIEATRGPTAHGEERRHYYIFGIQL